MASGSADFPTMFRNIFEQAAVGMTMLSPERRFLTVNPAFCEMTGYTPEELSQTDLLDITHAQDRPAAKRWHLRLINREIPGFRQEGRYVRKDGGIIWVRNSVSAVHDGAGRLLHLLAISEDITARKNAERTRLLSEARTEEALSRLAAIVQSSEDAIIGINPAGNISDWNIAAERLYGYREDEVRGIPFARLFAPETLAGLKREFSGFPFGRVVKVEDAVCLRSDASEVHVWLSISPVQDHSGKHLGAAAIARDISELQHMNESLQHLSGELLRSQDEERRRIARELHDSTAQGLAGVAMNLAVLERSKAVAAEPRASKLVGEALSLARQCAKEVRALSYLLHPPLLDELGLASALRSYAEGFTERTGIQLRLELPQDFGRFPPEVETTLFRIVQECLANVHRHSGSPQAVIRIRRGPGQVALEVEDEGHGLLQGALSTGGRGSVRLGVGIPGMRERARQLGGKLEIVSGRQGTRVRVILPLQPSEARA